MNKWIETKAGRSLLQAERLRLEESLPDLYGHYLLQYSAWDKKVVENTTLKHDFFVTRNARSGAKVDFLQQPFRENSMDCVLAHHVLDQCDNPHQALREAARVVVPNGYLIVVGFNPWSLWGVSRFIPKSKSPEGRRYISKRRVTDWLNLLGFRVEQVEQTQFLPPLIVEYAPNLSKKVDSLASEYGVPGGGVYVMVARKLVAGRTPIRPQWRALTGGRLPIATPSTRGMRVSDR
jgi:SAM-dependent methyltransferase